MSLGIESFNDCENDDDDRKEVAASVTGVHS